MSEPRTPPRTALSDLGLLQREINQLFERLAGVDHPEQMGAGEWTPSIDVYECRGKLVIVAEVPGVAPEALRVVCRDHQLVISGKRPEPRPPDAAGVFLCVERTHGRFRRAIPLDMAVDLRKAEARLGGGLLTISIPRLKDRRGRATEIPIVREDA
jgi:HSP20 family protein